MSEQKLETPTPAPQGVMQYFPLPSARGNQKIVIEEIDKVFKSGTRIVVLEAPVGSGKSAIAVTLAKSVGLEKIGEAGVGGAHVITPRKSLQDQYYDDFSEHIVLMKGRNAYPCTFETPPRQYAAIVKAISEGKIKQPDKHAPNCAEAPCKGSAEIYQICTEGRQCPYVLAISIAQENGAVVHNLHSFIYQSNFGGKFDKRELLIVDEAHEIENTIRGFVTKKIVLKHVVSAGDVSTFKTLEGWHRFFMQPKFIPEETQEDKNKKANDKAYISSKEEYLRLVESLTGKEYFDKGFSVEYIPVLRPGTQTQTGTIFEFVPHYVGGAVNNMLLDYGTKVLLMSGTIYNKELFCRNLGIKPEDAHFIRIGSTFPKENRPIIAKQQYQVNTSHAKWNENFAEMIEKTQSIMAIFKEAKGLIHAPSYMASEQIKNALNSPRVVNHTSSDFLTKLEDFYASKEPLVFVSPICQQGVDFKDDRARFQVVVRVPYMSIGSAFVKDKVETDYPWYNYQALITFGQQIGRVNRSDGDYGATFLLDDRFNSFISKNSKMLPSWVKEGIVWR